MDISSVSNASYSRSVTPSKNGSDRQANEQSQAALVEAKAQDNRQHERAVQEKLQRSRDESQRRLDGRLISFGHNQQDEVASQENKASYNRSRVNEAYSAPPRSERPESHQENTEQAQEREVEAIDIIV